MHAQRLHLESIGHPDFCGGEEEKSAPGSDATALKARALELKGAVKSWNTEISAAKAANRRLRLLDGPQLLRFVQFCRDRRLPELLPYVLLCFPEAMNAREALADALKAAIAAHAHDAAAASDSPLKGPVYLARAVALVRSVAEALGGGPVPLVDLDEERKENASSAEDAADEAELQAQGQGSGAAASEGRAGGGGARKAEAESQVLRDVQVRAQRVFLRPVRCHAVTFPLQSTIVSCLTPSGARMTDDEVYRIVMQHVADAGIMPAPSQVRRHPDPLLGRLRTIYDRRPASSPPHQITWAAASTTPLEVVAFVMRAAAFPALRFAIVGVNKLAVPARESLMRAILSRRGRRARLALVFTESTGQTSLSLVMKVRLPSALLCAVWGFVRALTPPPRPPPPLQREDVGSAADVASAANVRRFKGPAGNIFSTVHVVAGAPMR